MFGKKVCNKLSYLRNYKFIIPISYSIKDHQILPIYNKNIHIAINENILTIKNIKIIIQNNELNKNYKIIIHNVISYIKKYNFPVVNNSKIDIGIYAIYL